MIFDHSLLAGSRAGPAPPPGRVAHIRQRVAAVGIGALAFAAPLAGSASMQADPSAGGPDDGWNSPRVLELVDRARDARAELSAAGGLRSYRADIDGHVYFFLDTDTGERPLIRIDQVAVDVSWRAPDHFQQHIVGHRSEVRLPVREFNYYLDRLTLVRHGFGDEIRIGSGRDVAGVPHPLARSGLVGGGGGWYDARLADSLTLSIPQRPDPLRIYEVEIRPADPGRPGIVGSIYLERASASVVRMEFTFTPASYTDPRNDRVSVYLDYGLWENRFWLPNLQRIEVRREIPRIDIGVGTVIRSVLRVRSYDLDAPLPPGFETAPRVTTLPEAERASYPFREGLYAAMERDGLGDLRTDVDPDELRARAYERLQSAPTSGLSALRLHVPAISSAVRFDRVRGLGLGAGVTLRTGPESTLHLDASYAFADGRPHAAGRLQTLLGPDWTAAIELGIRELADLGLSPGSAPITSSLSATTRGEDYLDPYWASRVGLRLDRELEENAVFFFGFGVERHQSAVRGIDAAPLDDTRSFREVRPVEAGEYFHAALGWRGSTDLPAAGRGRASLESGLLHGQSGGGASLLGELDARWGPASGTRELRFVSRVWTWFGDDLPQGHRLLGGRGTVPGFPYRAFAGQRAAHASLLASTDLRGPLVRLRGGLHSGWSAASGESVSTAWGTTETDGVVGSVSLGVGLAWDLVRLDLARGLGGGEWQLILSLDPAWWDLL